MAPLPSRPDLTASDWRAVRRIYRKVFWRGLNPDGFRATWQLWFWGAIGAFIGYQYRAHTVGMIGSLLFLAVVVRAGWRLGHQEGYEVGFDEGFERGWFGAHGIGWTREDLYDE